MAKAILMAVFVGLTLGSCIGVASAKPRGPKVPKSVPVHVTFAADSVRATPRAFTREAGQGCTRRALVQGTGSVTICTSTKAPGRASR